MITLHRSHFTQSLVATVLTLLTFIGVASPSAAQTDSKLSFATVARKDAVLRNVPDANGRELAKLAKGSIVRIHGERAGWAKAETPTGFAVWVYRKYVTGTDDPKVVEITRNGLNVRVFPSSGVNNYPIGQLYAGDRVRVIETPAEFADSDADWIHIWSPPGFWAWIRTGQLTPLASGGLLAWEKAQNSIRKPKASELAMNKPKLPTESKATVSAKASIEALDRANAAYERERVRDKPNFDLVRSAYSAVLDLSPSSEVKSTVERRLETVGILEATASMKSELEQERNRIQLENEELKRAIAEDAKRKDPLGGQFDERGLLERRSIAEETRYYLRWGGKDVCEVVCTSGRYDLSIFLGLDVGVRGEVLPLVATDGGKTAPPIVDLRRIEIIAKR